MRLDHALQITRQMNFGRTDCALPMLDAIENNYEVDCFIILTDNETWFGETHPCQALEMYRRKVGHSAKLVVVSMTANKFSIADPNDAGTMDVVGFDSAAPSIINGFIRSGW